MTQDAVSLPRFPRLPALALKGLPLLPIALTLSAFSTRIAAKHPSMFRRLGEHAHKTFVLNPTDLPVTLVLEPRGGTPRIKLQRGSAKGDACISGPLAGLLGMVHGAYDGDALFFSRDLAIEGDTAAVLALRNAIDDAELDLSEEIQSLSGPLAGQMRRLIERAEKYTGVALTRQEEDYTW